LWKGPLLITDFISFADSGLLTDNNHRILKKSTVNTLLEGWPSFQFTNLFNASTTGFQFFKPALKE